MVHAWELFQSYRANDATTVSEADVESNAHGALGVSCKVPGYPSRSRRTCRILTDADQHNCKVAWTDLVHDVGRKREQYAETNQHGSHLAKDEYCAPLDVIGPF